MSQADSPIVLDGVVSNEKLADLLALQTEYPELDYKSALDISTTEDAAELAKDVGAMQVLGGYIVVGVDDHGVPTGALDAMNLQAFDEANLSQKMQKYLPATIALRTRVSERDGHTVVLIYVAPHPGGCAYFVADGKYMKKDREVVVFRERDVFWREGTRSVRMSQAGLERIIARRIDDAKTAWLAEQREIRKEERADLEAAYAGRSSAEAPLGTVNFDMSNSELTAAALEFIRRDDSVGLRHLLNDATLRARALIERKEIGPELEAVLDKIACLAATFLDYEETTWLERTVEVLRTIYSMPATEIEASQFEYSGQIPTGAVAPRVWLQIIERIFALGALAVRREQWALIPLLTLQHPARVSDYYNNWLRHALTMASRAHQLQERRGDQEIQLSLLALARSHIVRLDCLRPDAVSPDDEELLTSLAQFDVLSNVVAVVDAKTNRGSMFYPNFARVRQERIDPVVERTIDDPTLRDVLGVHTDEELADALARIGEAAHSQGFMFDGFRGWTPRVAEFIEEHGPPS